MCCALVMGICGACGEPPSAQDGSGQIKAAADQLRLLGYDEQADLLADGVVSLDDYYAAFGLFTDCVEKAGFTVERSTPFISPIDGLSFLYVVGHPKSSSVHEEDSAACGDRFLLTVQRLYRQTNVQQMDSVLAHFVGECMRNEGVDVSGHESTFGDFAGAKSDPPTQRQTVASDCLVQGVTELYPGIIAFSY